MHGTAITYLCNSRRTAEVKGSRNRADKWPLPTRTHGKKGGLLAQSGSLLHSRAGQSPSENKLLWELQVGVGKRWVWWGVYSRCTVRFSTCLDSVWAIFVVDFLKCGSKVVLIISEGIQFWSNFWERSKCKETSRWDTELWTGFHLNSLQLISFHI